MFLKDVIMIQKPPEPNGGLRFDHRPKERADSRCKMINLMSCQTGLSLHWDKDEDLRLLTEGTTYIHPHISTVTYLTGIGAPTRVLNHRVHCLTGEWISPDSVEGVVSRPCTGKHMSFDGRYLHAAPTDLLESGTWERQLELPALSQLEEEARRREEKLLKRRHRRVTFLVNVWLNDKPFDTKPFPHTMIDKMSGVDEIERKKFVFTGEVGAPRITVDVEMVPVGIGICARDPDIYMAHGGLRFA